MKSLRFYTDNQFGLKRGLSSSRAIYTVKSVVNEYCRSLSWEYRELWVEPVTTRKSCVRK